MVKRKYLTTLIATTLCGLMIFSAGCQSADTQTVIDSAEDIATIEVNQNDFRGGTKRIDAIRTNIQGIVKTFNDQNLLIEDEMPCSYWNSEEYQYFVSHLISNDIYYNMSLCNEFETDWATVESSIGANMSNSEGNLPQNYSLQRLTDNHYQLQYTESGVMRSWRTKAGEIHWTYDCVYNPTHDWLQEVKYARSRTGSDSTQYQDAFIEYGRLGNAFIIQTETERLYVIYENTEPLTIENTSMYIMDGKKEVPVTQEDIDSGAVNIADVQYHTNNIITYNPLLNNKIKAFYYSKLDGERLPDYVSYGDIQYEEVDGLGMKGVIDEGIDYDMVTPDGEVCNQYGLNDSIFPHINDIGEDWVTEKGTYAQVLAYENGDLTVTTQNKLSHQYEVFNFYADGTVNNYTKPMETVEPTTIPLETEEPNEAEAETKVSYNLFNLSENTSVNLGNGNTISGKKTTLPTNVSTLEGLGLVKTEGENFTADFEDYHFNGYKMVFGSAEAESTDTGASYIYAEETNGVVSAVCIEEGSLTDEDVALGGIHLGDTEEDIKKALGSGSELQSALGFYDGKGYLYVHLKDMKDENDEMYKGADFIGYFSADYKKALYNE